MNKLQKIVKGSGFTMLEIAHHFGLYKHELETKLKKYPNIRHTFIIDLLNFIEFDIEFVPRSLSYLDELVLSLSNDQKHDLTDKLLRQATINLSFDFEEKHKDKLLYH